MTTSGEAITAPSIDAAKKAQHEHGARIDDAYATLARQAEAWARQGRVATGWKIGLTSLAAQRHFDAGEPCFGQLFADMSSASGAVIEPGRFGRPRVEAEVAFRFGRDLPEGESRFETVADAITEVMPAIEIVDSRYPTGPADLGELIADNVSGAGYVLGPATTFTRDFDLASCRASVFRNGTLECAGSGSECLGSPLNALAWLAGELDRRNRRLREGEIVLSGSLIQPLLVSPGDELEVALDDLGSVQISFSGDA